MKQVILVFAAAMGVSLISGCHSGSATTSSGSQAPINYELRGISLGMNGDQVLNAAQAHQMHVDQNDSRLGNAFKVIILQDKSVKYRTAGGDNSPGSGIAMTIRVNSTTKKVV
jgi:outer membrane murein-binding lipoprotein Lpp